MSISSRSSNVLPVEIVTFTLTDAMSERNVVGRVYGNGVSSRIRTTVVIRARDGIRASVVDGYSVIGDVVAPRIRVRACGRESDVVALTEAAVAGDVHGGERVDCYGDVCDSGTTFGVGGCDSIDAALGSSYARTGTPIAPKIGNAAVDR